MRIIIAGGRKLKDVKFIENNLNFLYNKYVEIKDPIVVSGMCSGVDLIAKNWAEKMSLKVEEHPANWDKYGNRAGPIRNEEMAKKSDYLVAFWDGKSKGTKNMINVAKKYHLGIKIINY